MPSKVRIDNDKPPPPRVIEAAELLRGQAEVHIRHGGMIYRLKLTRNNRLILQR